MWGNCVGCPEGDCTCHSGAKDPEEGVFGIVHAVCDGCKKVRQLGAEDHKCSCGSGYTWHKKPAFEELIDGAMRDAARFHPELPKDREGFLKWLKESIP